MSFILDALRKSERERQRNSTPGLSRAPLAPQRRPTPIWTWLVIASLSVALAAVSALLLRDRGRDDAAAGTEAVAALRTASPAGAASISGTAGTAGAAGAAEPPAQTSEPRATASESPPARSEAPVAVAPAVPAPIANATPTRAPKPASELARLDPTLPAYTLELLAFNRLDPASGYAWINGRRYFRGERIGQGPELLEIRGDGVLLGWRGEVFLLRQR